MRSGRHWDSLRQAERLRLRLFTIELDPVTTNDVYETAFLAAVERAKRELPGLAAIAFGDLFLTDVRAYRERLLVPTGLDALFPIWGLDTAELPHHLGILALGLGDIARVEIADPLSRERAERDRGRGEEQDAFAHAANLPLDGPQ